mmetsp:Transcript_60588/g.179607  ORF Transcript_60588/g.179607 Transcript_60588/m.179607 type:complete len:318 (-) Transcript_60588:262-1215(-)
MQSSPLFLLLRTTVARHHWPASPRQVVRKISTEMIESGETFVSLSDGTQLPFHCRRSPVNMIIGHGLGAHPARKSWNADISYDIIDGAISRLPPGATSTSCRLDVSGSTPTKTAVFYTARGHGTSRGWEDSAAGEEEEGRGLTHRMFHWRNLAKDMLEVADLSGALKEEESFVAMGQSMGAATALYLAMDHPERIDGLVLMRAPRAWESRKIVASEGVRDAENFRRANPGTFHHLPLLGAWSGTDLPPKEDSGAYRRVQCPVLILSHGKDAAHPIDTGEALARLIPHAEFVTAEDESSARRTWPQEIANWLVKQNLV